MTGAANGIGRAIAEIFRAEGARVTGLDCEEGTDVRYDLAGTDGLAKIVDDVEREHGDIDVLCSVAGTIEVGPAVDMTLDSYRRVMAVNLDAPIVLAQQCGRRMAERGYGRIVNVTSVHARFAEPMALSYDVSKAGLEAATRTLAVALAPAGVLVNSLSPGFVRTRMTIFEGSDILDGDDFQSMYVEAGKIPLRRAAAPEEIAALAAWMCSDRNTYMTGQVVSADGGLTSTF